MLDAFTSSLFALLLQSDSAARAVTRAPFAVAQVRTDGDAAVAARAQTLLAELQAGTIDRRELASSLSNAYTRGVLDDTAKMIPNGKPTRFVQSAKSDIDGVTTYVFRVSWPAATVDYTFGFDDDSFAVVTLYVRPGPPP